MNWHTLLADNASFVACLIAMAGILAAAAGAIWVIGERRRLARLRAHFRSAADAVSRRETLLSEAAADAMSATSVLQAVMSAVEDLVVAVDLEGRILAYNKPSRLLFRESDESFIGTRLVDAMRPELVEESRVAVMLDRFGSIDPPPVVERFLRNRWWEFRVRPVVEGGKRSGLAIFIRNINERRAAERERERFKAMADALSEAVVLTDADLVVTYVNSAYEKMMGETSDYIVGKQITYNASPDAQRIIDTDIRKALQAGGTWEGIIPAIGAHGTPIDVLVRAGAVLDEMGQPNLFYGLVRDQSKELARRAQLEAARQRAERANADKTRFLASIAHDLREPVNAANLSLDTLAWELTGSEHERALEQTREALRVLKDALASALDLSRMELGQVVPKLENIEIGPQIRRAHATFLAHAQSHGLELRLGPLAPGAVVRTDPALLQRILWNLLSNAVRYTKSGGILIGCRRRHGRIRIEVWDTGIGIDPTEHGRIFDEHYRVDTGDIPRAGRGLGLAIVKRLAALLGIGVQVRSRPGHGTCFSCEVPEAEATFESLVPVAENAQNTRPKDVESPEDGADKSANASKGKKKATLSIS